MQKYSVKITGIAESDILETFRHISKDNQAAAIRWVEEIERQIHSLERLPLRCPVIPEAKELGKEYRHILYGEYRTIFKIERKKVIIMRVIHGARLISFQIFEK